MAEQQVSAIILAAGLSSRMEGFKPLLKIGNKTLIERAIGLFKAAGIEEIITVVGHRSEELIPFIKANSSRHIFNDNSSGSMYSSIQLGVQEMQSSCKAFFLLPVDIPLVQPSTIYKILRTYTHDPSALVYYPQYISRRGHPPLISSSLRESILVYNGSGGLRELLANHANHAIDIMVNDPFILLDADTPNDLSYLREKHFNR